VRGVAGKPAAHERQEDLKGENVKRGEPFGFARQLASRRAESFEVVCVPLRVPKRHGRKRVWKQRVISERIDTLKTKSTGAFLG
jgi:hypothetical protein